MNMPAIIDKQNKIDSVLKHPLAAVMHVESLTRQVAELREANEHAKQVSECHAIDLRERDAAIKKYTQQVAEQKADLDKWITDYQAQKEKIDRLEWERGNIDAAQRKLSDSESSYRNQLWSAQAAVAEQKAETETIRIQKDRMWFELTAAQAHNKLLRDALKDQETWFYSERKKISKGCGSSWDMLQCEEQEQIIAEALAIESPDDALKEHDAALVERIAAHLESYDYIKSQPPINYAEAHELRVIADKIRKGEF